MYWLTTASLAFLAFYLASCQPPVDTNSNVTIPFRFRRDAEYSSTTPDMLLEIDNSKTTQGNSGTTTSAGLGRKKREAEVTATTERIAATTTMQPDGIRNKRQAEATTARALGTTTQNPATMSFGVTEEIIEVIEIKEVGEKERQYPSNQGKINPKPEQLPTATPAQDVPQPPLSVLTAETTPLPLKTESEAKEGSYPALSRGRRHVYDDKMSYGHKSSEEGGYGHHNHGHGHENKHDHGHGHGHEHGNDYKQKDDYEKKEYEPKKEYGEGYEHKKEEYGNDYKKPEYEHKKEEYGHDHGHNHGHDYKKPEYEPKKDYGGDNYEKKDDYGKKEEYGQDYKKPEYKKDDYEKKDDYAKKDDYDKKDYGKKDMYDHGHGHGYKHSSGEKYHPRPYGSHENKYHKYKVLDEYAVGGYKPRYGSHEHGKRPYRPHFYRPHHYFRDHVVHYYPTSGRRYPPTHPDFRSYPNVHRPASPYGGNNGGPTPFNNPAGPNWAPGMGPNWQKPWEQPAQPWNTNQAPAADKPIWDTPAQKPMNWQAPAANPSAPAPWDGTGQPPVVPGPNPQFVAQVVGSAPTQGEPWKGEGQTRQADVGSATAIKGSKYGAKPAQDQPRATPSTPAPQPDWQGEKPEEPVQQIAVAQPPIVVEAKKEEPTWQPTPAPIPQAQPLPPVAPTQPEQEQQMVQPSGWQTQPQPQILPQPMPQEQLQQVFQPSQPGWSGQQPFPQPPQEQLQPIQPLPQPNQQPGWAPAQPIQPIAPPPQAQPPQPWQPMIQPQQPSLPGWSPQQQPWQTPMGPSADQQIQPTNNNWQPQQQQFPSNWQPSQYQPSFQQPNFPNNNFGAQAMPQGTGW